MGDPSLEPLDYVVEVDENSVGDKFENMSEVGANVTKSPGRIIKCL